MYLIDTNVFLEYLLDQDKASSVTEFFEKTDCKKLWVTDFCLHSIGIVFARNGLIDKYQTFLSGDISDNGIRILSLHPMEIDILVDAVHMYNLDFDDVYQYSIARIYHLKIVSFDRHFDKTDM